MELELGIVKFIELTIDLTEKILINVELMREEKSWKREVMKEEALADVGHWNSDQWRQKMFEELTIENWNDCMGDEAW